MITLDQLQTNSSVTQWNCKCSNLDWHDFCKPLSKL